MGSSRAAAAEPQTSVRLQDDSKVPGARALVHHKALCSMWDCLGGSKAAGPIPRTLMAECGGLERFRRAANISYRHRRRCAAPATLADYRNSSPVALKYVKRGYHVLCSHGLTLVLMPLAAMGVVSSRGGHWMASDCSVQPRAACFALAFADPWCLTPRSAADCRRCFSAT